MTPRAVAAVALAFALGTALAACGGSDPAADAPARPLVFGGDRPATLHVPDSFDASKTYPLLVVLHGYGATGLLQESYFGVRAEVDAGNALEIAPDGDVDSHGAQFWNADPACCDMDGTHPDDSTYLAGVITDVMAAWPVDPTQVFVIGHSNGGYMAYRMACDHADLVTTIGVLAGIVSTDPAACHPAHPVNVLHIHGTADAVVPYPQTADYAGAVGSVTRWAGYDGCATTLTPTTTADFDAAVPGAETQISAFACPSPAAVELWTLAGSPHVPPMNATFEPALWAWLTSHPRS